MENNVFETPESDLTPETLTNQPELGSRWARLGAAIIDAIVIMLIVIPIQYFLGAFDNLDAEVGMFDNIGYNLLMGLLGVLIYLIINGNLLLSQGQTVGKKLVGTQIVNDSTFQMANKGEIIKRYGTYFGCNLVPVIGGLLSLINILFIFGSTKQCLHDKVGGTVVINK